MAIRKKCPQVYWSQTNNEINVIVDLLLDDEVSANWVLYCVDVL